MSRYIHKANLARVKTLSNMLRNIENKNLMRSLSDQQKLKLKLKINLEGCGNVLTALNIVLDQYHDLCDELDRSGLTRTSRRLWKRLTFEPRDVGKLRSRLTSNVALLNLLTGSVSL